MRSRAMTGQLREYALRPPLTRAHAAQGPPVPARCQGRRRGCRRRGARRARRRLVGARAHDRRLRGDRRAAAQARRIPRARGGRGRRRNGRVWRLSRPARPRAARWGGRRRRRRPGGVLRLGAGRVRAGVPGTCIACRLPPAAAVRATCSSGPRRSLACQGQAWRGEC